MRAFHFARAGTAAKAVADELYASGTDCVSGLNVCSPGYILLHVIRGAFVR